MYPNLIKFPTLDHFGVTRFLDNSILWSGLWNRQVAMGWRPHTRSWSCRPPHPPTELATSHLYNARKACAILVGGWPTPLKNDGVKVPTEWKNKKCSKAPTRIEMRVLPGAHQRYQHIGRLGDWHNLKPHRWREGSAPATDLDHRRSVTKPKVTPTPIATVYGYCLFR